MATRSRLLCREPPKAASPDRLGIFGGTVDWSRRLFRSRRILGFTDRINRKDLDSPLGPPDRGRTGAAARRAVLLRAVVLRSDGRDRGYPSRRSFGIADKAVHASGVRSPCAATSASAELGGNEARHLEDTSSGAPSGVLAASASAPRGILPWR